MWDTKAPDPLAAEDNTGIKMAAKALETRESRPVFILTPHQCSWKEMGCEGHQKPHDSPRRHVLKAPFPLLNKKELLCG